MINIDDREDEMLVSYLEAKNIPYKVMRLDEGDFTNDSGTFVLERKTWNDYINSVKTRHLITQLARMREKHPNTPIFLLFEGSYGSMINSCKNKPQYEQIMTFRYMITHVFGVQFIESANKIETVNIVKILDDYAGGIKDKEIGFEPMYIKKNKDQRLRSIMAIPGVGQKDAEIALAEFGSVYDFYCACEDYPERVIALKGWGKIKVDHAVTFFYKDEIYLRDLDKKRKKKQVTNQQDVYANKKRKQSYAIQASYYNRGKR